MADLWGKRGVETRSVEGMVADFCPFCRTITPHELIRWGRAHGLQGIPLGKGHAERYDAICKGCRAEQTVDRDQYAQAVDHYADLADLVARSHPQVNEEFRERLDQEARLRRGDLPDEERAALLREGLQEVMRQVRREIDLARHSLRGDVRFNLIRGFIAAVILIVVAAVVRNLWVVYASFAALAGFWLYAGYLAFTYQSHVYKTIASPLLVRTWAPLSPSLKEIEAIFARQKRSELSKKLPPAKIHAMIQQRASG